jgi:DNA polymerase-3 subunit delta
MPTATEHAFGKTITAGAFAPVYYLWGDDDFRKSEAVGRAIDAAVPPTLRDFNVEVHRGGDLDAEMLESILGTPPMMADRRVVAVRDVEALKKDARRALDRYLDRPAADTTVFLVATAGAKPDAALREQAVAVEYPELTGDRLPKWIAHRASELHATITPEAAALLQQAVGPELAALASEVDKLVSYVRGAVNDLDAVRHADRRAEAHGAPAAATTVTIDADAVAAVVGVRRGETLSDLLDRIAARDAVGALALIEHVLAQPKTTAVSIVMALSVQTLAMAWGRARRDEGVPSGRLASEYFTLLKETGAYPMRPWGEAIAAWVGAVDRWSAPALDRALDALLATDVALKDTRVSTDEQLIASLVLAMCASGEPREGGARSARTPVRAMARGARRGVSA